MEVKPGQAVQERINGAKPVEGAPPSPEVLSVTPLGGVGEIGKNFTVIEYGGKTLIIDCGLRFPNVAEHPGIDLIIPDFSYLRSLGDSVVGLLLTHGHEDHIGALAFLLKERPLTVYGTRFTLALAQGRVKEMGLMDRASFVEVASGGSLELAPFSLRFFSVCHSVCDGIGVAVGTPLGLLVHTGDFKFDSDPVDGRRLDREILRQLGDEGVLVLLSDSTNVELSGWTPGERSVRPALERALADAKGRVFLTSFASHVHRFQQVLDAAADTGRKVCTLGRSMEGNMRMARELGYLRVPEGVLVDLATILRLPPDRGVVVSTGSQGEPRSGLARLADGTHTDLAVAPGDVLVYSARAIPGNERTVAALINNFYRRGAEVITERHERVHVSGHGSREDGREMIRLIKPRYFLPAHGELRHQVNHQRLAFDEGITADRVFLLENGQRWTYDGKRASANIFVAAGEVLVDGLAMGDVDSVVLRDRQHLREDGMVVCSVGLSRRDGEVLQGPYLLARGLMAADLDGLLRDAESQVHAALSEQSAYGKPPDWDQARDLTVTTLKRFFKKKLQARPVIVPAVLEL
ncbi:MAG: ribonuclease J [bacterium]